MWIMLTSPDNLKMISCCGTDEFLVKAQNQEDNNLEKILSNPNFLIRHRAITENSSQNN